MKASCVLLGMTAFATAAPYQMPSTGPIDITKVPHNHASSDKRGFIDELAKDAFIAVVPAVPKLIVDMADGQQPGAPWTDTDTKDDKRDTDTENDKRGFIDELAKDAFIAVVPAVPKLIVDMADGQQPGAPWTDTDTKNEKRGFWSTLVEEEAKAVLWQAPNIAVDIADGKAGGAGYTETDTQDN